MEVCINRELIQQWMTEGWQAGQSTVIRCTKGLPEGARFSSRINPMPPLALYFEHDSFPIVGENERIPTMVCEFSVEEGQ